MAHRKKNAAPESRAHILYTGRVQGVGFRYTAERIAQELGLTGWVKNLPDGSVEVVCEGDRANAQDFVEKIQQSVLGRYIKKVDVNWDKPTGEFQDFRVEFCL